MWEKINMLCYSDFNSSFVNFSFIYLVLIKPPSLVLIFNHEEIEFREIKS